MTSRGVILIHTGEQVIRLINDDNHLPRRSAQLVGDDECRSALIALRLGALFVHLADKMHATPEPSAERFGKFAFPCPWRAIKQDVGRADAVAGRDDASRQFAHVAYVVEILPGQGCRLRIA